MTKRKSEHRSKPGRKTSIKHPNKKFDFWSKEPALTHVKVWAMNGATNDELAAKMGIATSTLNYWTKKSPEFSDAINLSKEVADAQVVFATFKNATGYHYVEEQMDNKGHVAPLSRWQPANATIQKFWLMNRQRKDWHDKQEIEMSGRLDSSFDNLGTDELIKHLEKLEDGKDGLEPKQS